MMICSDEHGGALDMWLASSIIIAAEVIHMKMRLHIWCSIFSILTIQVHSLHQNIITVLLSRIITEEIILESTSEMNQTFLVLLMINIISCLYWISSSY